MKKIAFLLLCSLITSCAHNNSLTPEKENAVNEVRLQYYKCILDNAKELMGSTDDVKFLTDHIMSLCDMKLNESNDKLESIGLDRHYRKGYIAGIRYRAKNDLSSMILRYNMKQKEKL